MFGKKIDPSPAQPAKTISVQTMPADFYGGVNPVVKFKKVEKEIVLDNKPKLTDSEKKLLDKSLAVGSGDPLHAVNILSNKKYMLIFWPALFILFIAAAGGYYYFQTKKQSQNVAITPPIIEVPTTTEVIVPTTTELVATTSASTTSIGFLPEAPIEFPSYLLGDSADLDKDNISDVAEELFGTDPANPDTDADGYNDGHEVFYLYNPAGKEPIRLVESQFVKEYKNPAFGYSILYPANWASGVVDPEAREVLFSTLTGENIELRTFDLSPNESFSDWFVQWAPEQNYQNLEDFQTKFFEPAKNRNDHLVYYFFDTKHVYVLLYHTTDSSVVNFRSVMVMMARSFKSADFVSPAAPPSSATSTMPTDMPTSTSN